MKKLLKALTSVIGMLAAYLLLQILILMAAGALYALGFAVGELLRTGTVENAPLLIDHGASFITAHAGEMVGLSNLLSLGIFALHYRNKYDLRLRDVVGFSPLPPVSLLPVGIMALSMAIMVSSGLPLLPFSEATTQAYAESFEQIVSTGLLSFLSAVLIAPLFEEVLFRGMIYNRLKGALPPFWAAILTSLLFGLLHQEAIWICYTFFVSLTLCLVYEKYGSLLASVVFHTVFNLIGGYVTDGIRVEYFLHITLLIVSAAVFVIFLIRTIKRPMADGEE